MQPYNSVIPPIPAWSEAPTSSAPLAGSVLFGVGKDQPGPAPHRSDVLPPQQSPWSVLRRPQLIARTFGSIEALILIRVVLKLLAANPAARFTGFLYAFTDGFVAPFQGVFSNPGGRGSVFELTSILAVIIYALLGRLLVSISLLADGHPVTGGPASASPPIAGAKPAATARASTSPDVWPAVPARPR